MKQQSHLILFGRVTGLMDAEDDIYGKDFKVYKPLDIEIIWELYYLKHIWKISLNLNNWQVLWDAAGAECFHRWLGYWNNV